MKTMHYIGLLLVVVVIVVAPLVFLSAEFGGADGAASDLIEEDGYQPWIDPIWEAPSGEIESLLFVVQATIGALIIGYFVGYERGKRKKEIKQQLVVGLDEKQ